MALAAVPIPAASRSLRIALVLHDLAGGGTERVTLQLAAEWKAQGADPHLILGDRSGVLEPPANVPVHLVAPAIPRSPLSRLRLGRALVAPVEALAPDILVLPGNWHFLLARGVARVRPRPLILAKLTNPPVPRAVPFAGAVLRALTAPVDAFVAWPPPAAEHLERLTPGKLVTRIPNPPLADTVVVRPARRSPGGRLLVAGRLVRQKRMALAIQALVHLPRCTLDIAGDGPQRQELEALAGRLGVAPRIRFHGHVASIRPLLEEADALLLPSRFAGTPAVALEALAAGVPVVATPCSKLLPFLLDRPGRKRIVSDPSPRAFAAAVRDQLATPADMGDIAAALAPYQPPAIAAAWLALFRSLLDRG